MATRWLKSFYCYTEGYVNLSYSSPFLVVKSFFICLYYTVHSRQSVISPFWAHMWVHNWCNHPRPTQYVLAHSDGVRLLECVLLHWRAPYSQSLGSDLDINITWVSLFLLCVFSKQNINLSHVDIFKILFCHVIVNWHLTKKELWDKVVGVIDQYWNA